MESIDLKRLDLTIEESRDIINFIAQKRGISTKKLLSTIKPNLKRKNNEILTTKTQQNMVKSQKTQHKLRKTQHELRNSQHELRKSQHELRKSQKSQKTQQNLIKSQKKNNLIKPQKKQQQNLIKSQQKSFNLGKRKNTQNLTYEKPSKLAKRENLTSQKQQIMSKNKKRIETTREKLKELHHKLSKSDLKTIKSHLYNIENKKELLESEITKEYFDELDKKFLEFDDNDNDDDFIGIENVQDLFKISIYKPTIVKSGYNNNYIEYRSEGDKLLTIEEYLNLIEPYLRELINDHKTKVNGKSN